MTGYTDQAESTEVRVEVTVEVPLERAFTVFTERFNDWWPRPLRLGQADLVNVRIEPRVGGRWYERTADGKECDWGRVLAWDPPTHVALSWQIAPDFTPEPDEQRASWVDVWFKADGPERTTVTLVHSELERHGADWRSMHNAVGGQGGWPGIIPAYATLANGAEERH